MSVTFGEPQLYTHPQTYHVVAQAFALLLKVPYPFGEGDSGRRATALQKFERSEKLCRITTRRLDYYWAHPDREDPVMRVIFTRARALIDKVLGSVDNALPSVIQHSRFGPGMTFCSADSARTTPYYKFGARSWSVTSTCRPYASLAVLSSPNWVASCGEIDFGTQTVGLPWRDVQSCRLTFVPKDESTYRTIAIEPFGNVLVQLGVHSYLAKRLQTHAGIDIHDQKWNQLAARRGSTDWLSLDTVSTIDLSSASDCVSPGLIRRLVRPQWVAFLDDLRSHHYEIDGQTRTFHKWSSMGNGYTFALETLLFWALAQVCEEYVESSRRALAYGDDIIVSRGASLLVLQVLRYAGFLVNSSKTFVTGPFRESCGADFHTGVNVRPIFQKEFSPKVTDVFVLLNTLGVGATFSTDECFVKLLEAIPLDHRHWGPPSLSTDSHIHAPWWWLHKTRPKGFRYNRITQSHYHSRLVFKPKVYGGEEGLKYLVWLYENRARKGSIDRPAQAVVTRRSRGSYRVRSTPCLVMGMDSRDYFFT